jgi:hypothetical protein
MNFKILLRPMAYLDPGTGSFMIQMLLAGLVGIAVAIRIFWKKIMAFIKKPKNDDTLEELDKIDENFEDNDFKD